MSYKSQENYNLLVFNVQTLKFELQILVRTSQIGRFWCFDTINIAFKNKTVMNKKHILLTGASGTVGQEALKQLIADGNYQITVFDIRNKKTENIFAPYIQYINIIYGDISNETEVKKIPNNLDAVIHLAAIIPPLADELPELAYKINVLGTKYLIERLEEASPDCFVLYSSSISVYGDRVQNPNIKVSDPIQLSLGDEYGATKVEAEQLLQNSKLKWSIFRLAAIMKNHKISKLMFHMPLATTFEICTAEDTASAFVLGIEKEKELQNKIFNLGGGENACTTYKVFLEKSFSIYGLGKLNFPEQAFASHNFHCGRMADGDELAAIVPFRKDDLNTYYKQVENKVSKTQKILTLMLAPFFKWYLLRQSEPYKAYKNKDKQMLQRFFKPGNTMEIKNQWQTSLASVAIIFVLFLSMQTQAQTVSLQINNFQSNKGQICIAVFKNQKQFETERPAYAMNVSKSNVRNGSLTVDIPLSAGEYGISILDDANKNGKMNYKLMTIPEEGFGFSNYYHSGMKKPLFRNFKFSVLRDEIKKIKVKLRYIF